MFAMQAFKALVVAAAVGAVSAVHLRRGRTSVDMFAPGAFGNASLLQAGMLGAAASAQNTLLLGEDANAQNTESEARLMVSQLLASKVTLRQAMAYIGTTMSVSDATLRLTGKLPADVTSMLGAHGDATFSEESMNKARKILNKMIEDAYAELDDALIECKAWENSNRVTYDQVSTDLARLGSEIANVEGHIAEAYNCITMRDKSYRSAEDVLQTEASNYQRTFAEIRQELEIKKNDLAVFTFILDMVKCTPTSTNATTSAAFLQVNESANHSWLVCNTPSGLELEFGNPLVQQKAEKMMTLAVRKAIDEALALATVFATGHTQGKSEAKASQPTTSFNFAVTASPVPVIESPPKVDRSCKPDPGIANCAGLTDTLAVQWGKFKDLVDELQAQMDRSKDEWERTRANLNSQMDIVSGQKADCQATLAGATGEKNMLTAESDGKTAQVHELQAEYTEHMASCKAKIESILYTDVCAVRSVRNAVLMTHPTSSPDKIEDCVVDDWTAEVCSVPCDDSCPKMTGGVVDPFSCGGTMNLRRRIVVNANEFGYQCPALTRTTRCSQYKCPVNCVMSEWSGWSKCTKDCGGGERQQTRSILVVPKHGGKYCNTPIDTEPCNTGSCDRNCALDDWTGWSFCSMSCNPGNMPGFKERVRKVAVPIRGMGTCPAEDSALRYDKAVCNDRACIGDEICVAKQDLIILMDGSGSMLSSGFDIIKEFVKNVTGHYYPTYYGEPAVRLGVVLFGNGQVLPDGTITPAIQVSSLTADFGAVRTAVEAVTWQRGFTNLAQAFMLADKMFSQGGRSDALTGVLVLWDGKPSFQFETTHAANKLKEKGAMVYMAPISETQGEWETPLKEWASQPWETNYMRIPGYDALKYNMKLFSPAVIAKFCSDAVSPTLQAAEDDRRGYMLIHEGGFPSDACGAWYSKGNVDTLDDCAEAAMDVNYQAFSITEAKPWFQGKRRCYAEAIHFTEAQWTSWLTNRADVPCEGGTWIDNPYYDVYAINPTVKR